MNNSCFNQQNDFSQKNRLIKIYAKNCVYLQFSTTAFQKHRLYEIMKVDIYYEIHNKYQLYNMRQLILSMYGVVL